MDNPFDVDKSTIAPGAEVRLRCVEGHVVFRGTWSEAQKHLKVMCAHCDAGDFYEEDLDEEDRELRAEIVPPPPPPVPVIDWRARAEKAEAENASLRAAIRNLESRSVQAEAQASAMRSALLYAAQHLQMPRMEALRKIEPALSSDAGRDLLKERDGLRRAVDGAIARLSEGGLADGSARVGDVVAGLRDALAALDGGTG